MSVTTTTVRSNMEHDTEMTPAARPSEVLVERMKYLRNRQGMTAQDLAAEVARHGGNLSRATIAKIESGLRGVSLDEALLLAYALNVAPVHLFVLTDEQPMLIGRWTVGSGRVREWVRGTHPALGGIDRRVFDTEVPENEWSPPSASWRPLTEDPDARARHAMALRQMADELGGRVVFTDEHGNQLVYPPPDPDDETD